MKGRKRGAPTDQPREPTPIVVSEDGASSEERGDFEAYSEHLMLSPIVD